MCRGNHDRYLGNLVELGTRLAGVQVAWECEHELVDGRRMLTLHGDAFDPVLRNYQSFNGLGVYIQNALVTLNGALNSVRSVMEMPFFAFSEAVKRGSKRAMQYILDFETLAAQSVAARGVDGVICGHIHAPKLREIDGVLYGNCGDWVENCTALAETFDGELKILDWKQAVLKPAPASAGNGQNRIRIQPQSPGRRNAEAAREPKRHGRDDIQPESLVRSEKSA